MRFSTRTEYGLRAMVQLAKYYKDGAISLSTIASHEKISQPYLERLMARLKSDSLVQSTKGVRGGYRLARKPADISLFEVVESLEGPIIVFDCLADNTNMVCTKNSCLTKKIWFKIQDSIIQVLRGTKLSDLI